MRFGTRYRISRDSDSPVTKTHVSKFRDYGEYVRETINEERRQIIKIQDFDTIVAQMHKDHVLCPSYGAWLEKTKDGNMYVVMCWIEEA